MEDFVKRSEMLRPPTAERKLWVAAYGSEANKSCRRLLKGSWLLLNSIPGNPLESWLTASPWLTAASSLASGAGVNT